MMELSEESPVPAKKDQQRRPMNAFLLFCKRHRAIVKEVYPNLENRHITKILGEFWGSLSQEEKMPFNDLAASYKDHLMKDQLVKKGSNAVVTSISKSEEPTTTHSQGSSGSSSPEPGNGGSSSAPKPFKKRYLAAEKAKNSNGDDRKSAACEALLKLAEGNEVNGKVKSSSTNPYDKVKETAQFSVLRQAVWTRVAKTILTQEEEKGKNMALNHANDKPINLSSQCLIPNSTIIEHIIENILNDNDSDIPSTNDTECSEQIKEKIYQSLKDDVMRRTSGAGGPGKDGSNDLTALWKMLPNPTGGLVNKKQNGIQNQPQKAHSAPASQSGSGAPSPKSGSSNSNDNVPTVSVTLVTETDVPLNLSKTPPQTPGSTATTASSTLTSGSITITTTSSPAKRKLLDDDDDDVRRSSRACKGRRYQEFKDAVGHRRSGSGKGRGLLDGNSQHSEDESCPSTQALNIVKSFVPSAEQHPISPFDLEKALMSIPALRPEEFQRRIQASRQRNVISAVPSAPGGQGEDSKRSTKAQQSSTSLVSSGHC